MRSKVLLIQIIAGLFFVCAPVAAQDLTIQIGSQSSAGNVSFYASLTGAPDFSGCTLSLKMAKSQGSIDSGLGSTVYTFTAAQSANFPLAISFSDIDYVYQGKVYVKATLDCGDTFLTDSNVINKNFSRGSKRFKNAKVTTKFARFIKEVRRSIDSGA